MSRDGKTTLTLKNVIVYFTLGKSSPLIKAEIRISPAISFLSNSSPLFIYSFSDFSFPTDDADMIK